MPNKTPAKATLEQPATVSAAAVTRTPAAKKAPPRKAPPAAEKPKAPVSKVEKAHNTPSALAEKPAIAPKVAKTEKPKKAKLVRDSFTIPENEYTQIAAIKKRLVDKGIVAKKSEILRAGLALLADQTDAKLQLQIQKLTPIKTGRPAK